MTFTMAACSSSTEADKESDSTVKETILIGISPDYPPYESKTTDGEIVGFDPDMTAWLFEYLNENGYNYDYEFVELEFKTIISSLQAGQIDLGISGFTYDPERQGIFSDSYYDSAQVIVVTEDSEITGAADLNGKLVGAQQGTTGEEAANSIEGATVNAVTDAKLMMETLKANGIDAAILDRVVAENYVAAGGYKIVGEELTDEYNLIYSSEANQELMDQINQAIEAFKESDAYEELVAKWFTASNE